MRILKKILYIITRTFSIFSIPPLGKLRNMAYQLYLGGENLRVYDRVLITTAHKNSCAYLKLSKNIEIGRDAYIDYCGGLSIGANVAISEGAMLFTHNHNVRKGYSNWHLNGITFSPLIIEDDVWIGANALVMPNVRIIGRGAIIAAGAILTKDADEFCIYAGNPARKIAKREINNEV